MSDFASHFFLRGNKVLLRPFERSDGETIVQWHNDPELYKNLLGTCWPTTKQTVDSWIEKKMSFSTSEINLAICDSVLGEHVGNIYLREIDWVRRVAEIHIFIGSPSRRRQGIGQESIRLLCQHAFLSLGLRRIYLFVLADNQPAVRAYESVGFQQEGLLRGHAFKQGESRDVIVMGLLAHEIRN